ncbi:MAG TPA: cellulase family glycosylhydrolase [Prolixibacteraceae bacterium]|nr:cellulase family glycosylhydrolase [Prolixibacteraceae bacterium]
MIINRFIKEATVFAVHLFLVCGIVAQGSTTAPFNRGFNLTNWFQVSSPQQIQFTKYTRQDFEDIKSLGCDVIRLPINLHFMTDGAPDYTLDPLFLTFLDEVVGWAEDLEMHLILDNHTFSVEEDTDPNVGTILEKVWTQMATHYLDASERIYYEVLNEPHGIADNTWNAIQKKAVEAIRRVDTVHTIIVGPANWNNYNNLSLMPVYDDEKLIYTFHFYDPFLFTHQGAGWSGLADLKDIPFPYDPARMPEFPESLKTHWSYSNFLNYDEHGTIEEVHRLIDIAARFSEQRNVPVYCGEMGVYDLVSPNDDRTYWYGVVSDYFEEKGIAWTIWDYHGGFGIFNKNSNGMFEHDLNVAVVEMLGLTAPEQVPYVVVPDTLGFGIYFDYLATGIREASNTSGLLSYYHQVHPNSGNFCIGWTNAAQYNSVTFDFAPNKDLSKLVREGYALSLVVRGDIPNGQFDIRFVDTKTDDPADHPWRMRYVLNKQKVDWDGQWHKLFIPLTSFAEHGSWDIDTWYNPVGAFDWSAIDKLEIVTEYGAMGEYSLWIDDLVVSNRDTTQVHVIPEDNRVATIRDKRGDLVRFTYNPSALQIVFNTLSEVPVSFSLNGLTGKTWKRGAVMNGSAIPTHLLPKGMYILCFYAVDGHSSSHKLRIE